MIFDIMSGIDIASIRVEAMNPVNPIIVYLVSPLAGSVFPLHRRAMSITASMVDARIRGTASLDITSKIDTMA